MDTLQDTAYLTKTKAFKSHMNIWERQAFEHMKMELARLREASRKAGYTPEVENLARAKAFAINAFSRRCKERGIEWVYETPLD